MSVLDDEALSMRWLATRIAPVRRWIAGAAVSGVLATAAYATFANALAQLIGRWSRGDLSVSGWLLAFAIPAALIARSLLQAIKEWSAARASVALRLRVRDEVLDAFSALGPLRSSAGSDGALASVLIDQVDALDGYASRYRPQQFIVLAVPILIAALVFPSSWLAALILLGTAPLIPLFMVLVGRQAAAASTEQAGALARLGGQFLDLVRGLPTLRLLGRVDVGAARLDDGAQDYRRRSMGVLRIAFLSSAVLELFASIAIAMVALYLGLALLGRFNVGHYGLSMTLDKALFILLLAPEFFAPLRQLGSDYHARAQAIAAATAIRGVLERVP
ncbi:MAG: ABC transporter transmembrane domain-containing protein, partial [Dokdonella sp.]